MSPLAALRREGEEVVALATRLAAGDVPDEDAMAGAALLAPMRGAPHDPVHHAEGDPLTHTAMVARELVALDGFAALPARHRMALALAVLLHDAAKPETAEVTGDRVSHPNHAPKGARKARAALYAVGVEPALREGAAHLCRRHMQPHHALRSRDGDVALLRWMAALSLDVPVRLVLMLARADGRGRASPKATTAPACFGRLRMSTTCSTGRGPSPIRWCASRRRATRSATRASPPACRWQARW